MDDATCCVSQCSSKSNKEIKLYKFPREENMRKKWTQKLKIDKEIDDTMYVCSLHFQKKDFQGSVYSSVKPLLRRGAIPSLSIITTSHKIPSRRTLQFKAKQWNLGTKKKTGRKAKKLASDVASSVDQSTESPTIESDHSYSNQLSGKERRDSSSENIEEETDSAPETSDSPKKDVSKAFVFVDVDKIKKNAAEAPLKVRRCKPNILRKRMGTSSRRNLMDSTRNNTVKSVSTQTESSSEDILDEEEEFSKISFTKIIEFLRKNLVGRGLKCNGNVFRINECSISFNNEDKLNEDPSTLVIQSNKLISSGSLLLSALLGNCEFEKLPRTPKKTEPGQRKTNQSFISQICEDISQVENFGEPTRKTTGDKKLGRKSSKNDKFKKVKVNVKKLPDYLVNVMKKGESLKVNTEKFLKDGMYFRRYTIKTTKNSPAEKTDDPTKTNIPEVTKNLLETKSLTENNSIVTDNSIEIENSVEIDNLETNDVKINPVQSNEPNENNNSTELNKCKETESPSQNNDSKTCSECLKNFQSLDDLNEHKKIHERPENSIEISEDVRNDSKEDVDEQAGVRHQNEIETVDTSLIVKKIAPRTILKSNTPIICKDQKTFVCEICQKIFKHYYRLAYHQRSKHNIMPKGEEFESNQPKKIELCPECPKAFQNSTDFDRHLLDCHKIVLKKSIYNCNECPKVFITFRSLTYHLDKIHDTIIDTDVVIKMKCKICQKIFEVDYYYKSNHIKECAESANGGISEDSNNQADNSAYLHEELLESCKNEEEDKDEDESIPMQRKRKYSLTTEKTIEAKQSRIDEESDEVFSKLKALLGSTEGSNDVTIEIDE